MPTLLSFGHLRSVLTTTFGNVPDNRTSRNRLYTLSDAALGAFSVFFTQTPSFLAYQRQMEQHQGRNNACSLFGIKRIPSDSHICTLLELVSAEHISRCTIGVCVPIRVFVPHSWTASVISGTTRCQAIADTR